VATVVFGAEETIVGAFVFQFASAAEIPVRGIEEIFLRPSYF
jgi:hypothetical protein